MTDAFDGCDGWWLMFGDWWLVTGGWWLVIVLISDVE